MYNLSTWQHKALFFLSLRKRWGKKNKNEHVLLGFGINTACILHSRSWEADRSLPSQEIPFVSWNPIVHCRIHISPTLAPILSHMTLVHVLPCSPFKINNNTVITSIPRYSNGLFSECISFPKLCMHFFSHMFGPSRSLWPCHMTAITSYTAVQMLKYTKSLSECS